jgi:hypothetical protein
MIFTGEGEMGNAADKEPQEHKNEPQHSPSAGFPLSANIRRIHLTPSTFEAPAAFASRYLFPRSPSTAFKLSQSRLRLGMPRIV